MKTKKMLNKIFGAFILAPLVIASNSEKLYAEETPGYRMGSYNSYLTTIPSDWNERSLEALNEYRAQNGLSRVKPSNKMTYVGLKRLEHMKTHSYFGHCLDTRTSTGVGILAGGEVIECYRRYNDRKSYIKGSGAEYANYIGIYSFTGDNVASGDGDTSSDIKGFTPEAYMLAWKNSPGHNRWLLEPKMTYAGFAVANSSFYHPSYHRYVDIPVAIMQFSTSDLPTPDFHSTNAYIPYIERLKQNFLTDAENTFEVNKETIYNAIENPVLNSPAELTTVTSRTEFKATLQSSTKNNKVFAYKKEGNRYIKLGNQPTPNSKDYSGFCLSYNGGRACGYEFSFRLRNITADQIGSDGKIYLQFESEPKLTSNLDVIGGPKKSKFYAFNFYGANVTSNENTNNEIKILEPEEGNTINLNDFNVSWNTNDEHSTYFALAYDANDRYISYLYHGKNGNVQNASIAGDHSAITLKIFARNIATGLTTVKDQKTYTVR